MDLIEELQLYLDTAAPLRTMIERSVETTIDDSAMSNVIEGFNYLSTKALWNNQLRDMFRATIKKRMRDGFFFFYQLKNQDIYCQLAFNENQDLYDYQGHLLRDDELLWVLASKDFDYQVYKEIQRVITNSRAKISFLLGTRDRKSILMGIEGYDEERSVTNEVHFLDPNEDETWIESPPIINTFNSIDRYITMLRLLDMTTVPSIRFQKSSVVYNYTKL